MKQSAYNDESANKPPGVEGIVIWDDRPRFLGMFSSYPIPPTSTLVKPIGLATHAVTCKDCKQHGSPHPKPYVTVAYSRIGNRIYTVSWPTWLL